MTYRFSYGATAAGADASKAVLVDTGGPGTTPLTLNGFSSSIGAFQDPAMPSNYLLIEEPWVTKTLDSTCRTNLANYYQTIRADKVTFEEAATASTGLARGCQLGLGVWGFAPATYRDVITAIEQKKKTTVSRFVGASFASIRSTYLDRPDLPTAILHPYGVGDDATQLLAARAATVRENFSNVFLSDHDQLDLADRSLPVNDFDRQSAAIYQGYTGDEVADDPTAIANASDALWGRYFTHDISAGWLAYWDEVCAVGDWDPGELEQLFASPDTRVLALMHLPCAGESNPRPVIDLDCVVTSEDDSVTPASIFLSNATSSQVITTTTKAHRSSDGLAGCWAALDR